MKIALVILFSLFISSCQSMKKEPVDPSTLERQGLSELSPEQSRILFIPVEYKINVTTGEALWNFFVLSDNASNSGIGNPWIFDLNHSNPTLVGNMGTGRSFRLQRAYDTYPFVRNMFEYITDPGTHRIASMNAGEYSGKPSVMLGQPTDVFDIDVAAGETAIVLISRASMIRGAYGARVLNFNHVDQCASLSTANPVEEDIRNIVPGKKPNSIWLDVCAAIATGFYNNTISEHVQAYFESNKKKILKIVRKADKKQRKKKGTEPMLSVEATLSD